MFLKFLLVVGVLSTVSAQGDMAGLAACLADTSSLGTCALSVTKMNNIGDNVTQASVKALCEDECTTKILTWMKDKVVPCMTKIANTTQLKEQMNGMTAMFDMLCIKDGTQYCMPALNDMKDKVFEKIGTDAKAGCEAIKAMGGCFTKGMTAMKDHLPAEVKTVVDKLPETCKAAGVDIPTGGAPEGGSSAGSLAPHFLLVSALVYLLH